MARLDPTLYDNISSSDARELPLSSGPISKLSDQKIQAEVSTALNQ